MLRRLLPVVALVAAFAPGCTATTTASGSATASLAASPAGSVAAPSPTIEVPRAGLDLALALVEPELFVHVPLIGKRLAAEVIAPRPPPTSTGDIASFDLPAALVEESDGSPSAATLRNVLRCEATMTDAAYGDGAAFARTCGMVLEKEATSPYGYVWTGSTPTTEAVVMTIAGTKHPEDLVADLSGVVLADLASLDDAARAPRSAGDGDNRELRVGLGWAVRWGQTGAPWWRDVVEPKRLAAARAHKRLELVLLGHSLGAAAAELGAFLSYRYLRERSRETGAPFHVRATTFGSPGLGSESLRTAYQRALAEGCDGKPCFSLHQMENHADLVHDMPGAGFVHPVWQVDNTSSAFGAGELGQLRGGDKSMYYANPRAQIPSTPLPQLMGYHLMRFWHEEVGRIPDEVLVTMRYL